MCRHSRCPTGAVRTTTCCALPRFNYSLSGPRAACPNLPRPRAQSPPSVESVAAWMACRSRSSWPRRGYGHWASSRSWFGWTTVCDCSWAVAARRRPANRPCVPHWIGATACSVTTRRCCSADSACSMTRWTLEAAEAVCAGTPVDTRDVLDLLQRLVDKSLVIVLQQDSDRSVSPARAGASVCARAPDRQRRARQRAAAPCACGSHLCCGTEH